MIYDAASGVVVVDPRSLRPAAGALELIPEHLARRYLVVALEADDSRLALGMFNPDDESVVEDVTLLTGLEVVRVRLDRGGGQLPQLSELVNLPPVESLRPWPATPDRLSAAAIWSLLEECYPPEAPLVPQDVPIQLPLDLGDNGQEASLLRVLKLVLRSARDGGCQNVWVMPRAKSLVILEKRPQGWGEMMTPTLSMHRDLMRLIKRAAGLDSESVRCQEGRIETLAGSIEVALHPGEHGEEAFFTL